MRRHTAKVTRSLAVSGSPSPTEARSSDRWCPPAARAALQSAAPRNSNWPESCELQGRAADGRAGLGRPARSHGARSGWPVQHGTARPRPEPPNGSRPGRAFAKCLINFGLRPDRPAGIRHRQPMGDRPLRTVAHDVTQRRGAHCSLLGGHQGADTVPCRCDFSDTRNSVISISLS